MDNLHLDYGIAPDLSNRRVFRAARLFWCGMLILLLVPLGAVDYLAEGEKQLGLNNPKKALTYLEAALAQGEPTEKLYLELGLTYTRLDMNADAEKAFTTGAELGGESRQTLLFNLAVVLTRSKSYSSAEAAYSTLLDEAPTLAEAWLNRANVRVQLTHFDNSIEDYKQYQSLVPENPQKDKIEKLIALLENASMEAKAVELANQTRKMREAEAQKAADDKAAAIKKEEDQQASLAAAEAAQKADAVKQEAERVAAEEQSKQDAILAQIRATLAGASADAKSLSTGPAGVKSDESDFALEP